MFTTRYLLIFSLLVICAISSSFTAVANPTSISDYEQPSRRLYKAHELCLPIVTDVSSAESEQGMQRAATYIRCMVSNMGLWTDSVGYKAKRVAKFFMKQHSEHEVMALVEYCNQKNQQENLDLWAFEAYRCATAGRMGTWLGEYVLSAKL
ncbi:uncharacterized protein LOC101460597 [Ceratitis capitata]|uniref:(Mediterranean fruit fly) hypothetical protein n=1 Tax=Ceratitis capitata TaxID=7213 RepID=W8C709_CERCA|nr:uncharacterized protein LOC101460597 [Ceratitis capitata]CAD6992771.1 unnamed protein product [Ceratitis capitata]